MVDGVLLQHLEYKNLTGGPRKCDGAPISHFLIFALSHFLILIFSYFHITLLTGGVLLP